MEKETKYCPRCEDVKPIEDFHKDKTRKDGRYSWCQQCVKERTEELNEFNDDAEPAKIPHDPGQYPNKKYQEYTFKLLEAFGWQYNEKKKIWYKNPLKDEDGRWILMKGIVFRNRTPDKEKVKKVTPIGKLQRKKEDLAIVPDWYVPTPTNKYNALSLEVMTKIRKEYQQPRMTIPKLAKKFGISESYCSNILNYKR